MKVCLRCEHAFVSEGWMCPACKYEPVRQEGFSAHAEELAHSGGGFKPEYFSELSRLEATNFWFRARNELIIWTLRKYQSNIRSFLEVGCGTGFVLSGIALDQPGMALHGSEIFIAGLPHAANRVPAANFMQMDARRIPFALEFDAIGSFDVLEHIEEDETVIRQLHQALKPHGLLLLTVPQHPRLWSASDEYACHVRRYTAKELHEKLVRNGFRIERSTSFVSLLLPAMLLSRMKNKQVDAYDPLAEMNPPAVANSLFLKLMRFEHGLIRLGINFPLGGSRLVVARKED